MASLGESLMPRVAALRGKVAPWSPRAGLAAGAQQAALRKYLSGDGEQGDTYFTRKR